MPTEEEINQEETAQQTVQRIRWSMNDAYTSILAQARVESFATFTFEEAMDAQIERIEGASTDIRPNELDRVDQVYNRLLASIEDVEEATSPEVDEDERANTA